MDPRSRDIAGGNNFLSCCTMTAGGLGVLAAGYLKSDFGLAGVFAGVSVAILLSGMLSLAGARWTFARDLASVKTEALFATR